MFSLSPDFFIGAGVTVAVLAVVGFVMNILSGWNSQIQAYYQRQPVIHFTKRTPAEIGAAASVARVKRFLFWLVVLSFCTMMVGVIFFPDATSRIIEPIDAIFGV